MTKYLGEILVPQNATPFADFTKNDWAIYWIETYGQFDGGHHKQWTMDQVVRILKGTPVIIKLAKWDDGQSEYRVTLGEPSKKYKRWIKAMKCEAENGEYEYNYDEGIAP